MDKCEYKKIIFAGPLQHKNNIGGIVVLFEDLVKEVQNKHIILDTNCENYKNSIFMLFNFVRYCIIAKLYNYEISLHGTAADYKYLGLILVIFSKCIGIKYNCRKFAGNFDQEYLNMPKFWKNVIVKMLKRSTLNYFETKKLVKYFSIYNERTYWLPNYRKASKSITSNIFTGKYVFIGQVKKEKGIDQILELNDLLPYNYSIDIYGPLIDYAVDQLSSRSIKYCGIIAPDDVARTLATYNALILPTYHDGEGYPGVIIEAFSVGLPVVTTDWLSLSEIVDNTCGALVQVKNSKSLMNGMFFVDNNYNRLRLGACKQFNKFDRELIVPFYLASLGIGKENN